MDIELKPHTQAAAGLHPARVSILVLMDIELKHLHVDEYTVRAVEFQSLF